MTMSNQDTAQTILRQLCGGPGRLCAMTGASSIVARPNGVQFKVSGQHPEKGRISHVAITLDPGKDLYHVDYFRIRAGEVIEVASSKGLYGDALKENFENNTQLYLSI